MPTTFNPDTDANWATVLSHRDKASSTYQAGGTPATGTGVTGHQQRLWIEAFLQEISFEVTLTNISGTIFNRAIAAADYAAQQEGARQAAEFTQ